MTRPFDILDPKAIPAKVVCGADAVAEETTDKLTVCHRCCRAVAIVPVSLRHLVGHELFQVLLEISNLVAQLTLFLSELLIVSIFAEGLIGFVKLLLRGFELPLNFLALSREFLGSRHIFCSHGVFDRIRFLPEQASIGSVQSNDCRRFR